MKTIQCQEPWFSKIKAGQKKIEGRKFSAKYASLIPGEILQFYCDQDSFLTEVVKVVNYNSLEDYLQTEGIEHVLPGVKSLQEAVKIYNEFSSKEALSQAGGFLAIHIRVLA